MLGYRKTWCGHGHEIGHAKLFDFFSVSLRSFSHVSTGRPGVSPRMRVTSCPSIAWSGR